MKKIIALILVSTIFLLSCDDEVKIQVRRTATKTIVLNYNINSRGSFSDASAISTYDIVLQFDKDPNFFGSEIEKLDIHSFEFGVQVDSKNTAQAIVLNANIKQVCYGSVCQRTEIKILDDTKTIQIVSNTAQDLLNAFGAITKIDKNNITLHNAIASVNAVGAVKIKTVLEEAFKDKKYATVDVALNGTIPNNQQAVMRATIVMNATLTYVRCEEAWAGLIFGRDLECG